MPEIDPVILQLRADVASYNATMQQTARRVDASLRLQEGSIVRLENRMTTGFERVGGSASRAQMLVGSSMNAIKGALAGVSAVALARSFLQISDEAKKLDAQLRLATQGFGSFGQAQEDVRRIADETRSGLSDTSGLYGNFLRVSKEMGASQTDAARATETLTKSYKISGASAVETAQSTRQLVQGLQSGVLRGDEFNSVMESSPRFARLLAESLGVPIGQLRAMAEEGELTAAALLRALTDKKFTAGIDAEFREMPVTFDDAMTKVYNAALITFSAFDKGGEFSSMLASFFTEGAAGFTGMEENAFNTGAEIRAAFAGLTDVFQPMLDAAFGAFDQIEGRANYARDTIGNMLRLVDNLDNAFIKVDNFGRRFDNAVKGGINEAQRRAGGGGREFSMTPLAKESDRAGEFLKSFNRSMASSQGRRAETSLRNMIGGYDVMGNPLPGTPAAGRGKAVTVASGKNDSAKALAKGQKLVADLEKLKATASGAELKRITDRIEKQKKINGYLAQGVSAEAARAAVGGSGRGGKSKLNPEAFAREEASLNDQILRLKAVEITNVDQKAQIELSRIEAAKLAAVKEVTGDERYTAEQRAKVIALTETVAALEAAKVVYQRDLETARDALELRMAGLRNDEDLLRAQANLATSRQERRDIELRLLDLAYQQERADLEAIIASKEATDAQKQIAKMRLAMLGELQGAEVEGVNRQNESPLEQRRREVRDTAASMGDAIENIELDAIDRLTDGLADAGTEFIKLGGIAGDVLNSIIRDMIRLAAQQAIFGSVGGAGGAIGGIGKLLGFSAGGYTGDGPKNRVAGVVHKGEYVVPAETVKRVGVSSLEGLSSGNMAARSMVGATATAAPRQTIVHQTVQVDARNSVNPEGFAQQILSVSGRQAQAAAAQAGQAAIKGVPARFAQYQKDGN